ncbi:MAG: 1-acyl-sn-glycerol-3-phosphate acyltransferase [Propionibacterium sp.]|nr:1-acyl-sn-glycerol-3-phosphate acyltransferase [Propionibacterium sp.]
MRPVIRALTRIHVHGKRNLRTLAGPYVVMPNHNGHLDTPVVHSSLPYRLSKYLATGAAADYFFTHWWRAAPTALFFNAFPIERTGMRNRKGLAGGLLSKGVPLLIYPEGTRSRNGTMAPFKPGAAALCISRHVPALPVALVGIRQAMPHGNVLPVPGRPEVHVVFGKPMWAEQGETAVKFAERIREQVATMHDQTALATGFPRIIDYQREALEAKSAAADDEAGDGTVEPEPDSKSDKES